VFISHFSSKIVEAVTSSQPIEIFDLGAGTGCVQFCFGLALVAYLKKGNLPPLLRFINIDLSPFMLDYLKSHLWVEAVKTYPELKYISVEYHIYSWSNKSDMQVTNPWICASYLFDSSDNEDYLVSNFEELIAAFSPGKIMLLTSAQAKKQSLMSSLTASLKKLKYQVIPMSTSGYLFDGVLPNVDSFRKSLVQKYNLKASSYPVTWKDNSFSAIGVEKTQSGFIFNTEQVPQKLDLYNPPLKIRREVNLNEEQKKAASFETRPSIITGPAGCGKSVVITEKIINIIEEHKWSKNLTILVTTFNKGLIKQLRAWIIDILDAKKKKYKNIYYKKINDVDDGTGEIIIGEQFIINIKFIHFEMLGKYIGNITYGQYNENNHIQFLKTEIPKTKALLNIGVDDMNDVLNPEFLLEEYHRVIYGLSCRLSSGENEYQIVERKGRGNKPRLERNSARRKAIWTTLLRYGTWMYRTPGAGFSFIARRQLFLNFLQAGKFKSPFDYVFVDEFQDCTVADYKIMSLMLKDVDNLVLAGDLAQSVHIGQSGTIPKDGDMSRRVIHRLRGSYRLPYRVSEAISPLSSNITSNSGDKDVTIEITPYKGAPPGARPIIVYADDDVSLANKLVTIKDTYSVFDLKKITILEKDSNLCKELNTLKQSVETTTILRLKGLEKELIVWSLQADILFENEAKEFAYTIMTRTNCLLIIAITKSFKPINFDIVKLLRSDRLILWDFQTTVFYKKESSML
jgi:DNA helicase-2/ATP-dependent DNA helicase PcrA